MRTCPSCSRHILAKERVCPFCGAERRTILAAWPALAIAVVALASCTNRTIGKDGAGASSGGGTPTTPGDGNDGGGPDGGASSSGGGSSSSGGPDDGGTTTGGPGDDGSTTGTDDGWTTGDGGNTGDGGAFIYGEADYGVPGMCDPGLQDCPVVDEKCTAYVTEPGDCCVDRNECVPIIGNKMVGETCERTEVNDDCAKGLFCARSPSGSTGDGVCLEFCVPNLPGDCEFGGVCVPLNDGVMPLCLAECDPLLQDCPLPMGCYPAGDKFVCAMPEPMDGAGSDGDLCDRLQGCLPGLVCVGNATAGCPVDACCTSLCDVTGPDTQCPEPTEECVPWFEPGQAPEGLEDVGACMFPP
jgi:hypothetical protein